MPTPSPGLIEWTFSISSIQENQLAVTGKEAEGWKAALRKQISPKVLVTALNQHHDVSQNRSAMYSVGTLPSLHYHERSFVQGTLTPVPYTSTGQPSF
jgi:hypothetical protein